MLTWKGVGVFAGASAFFSLHPCPLSTHHTRKHNAAVLRSIEGLRCCCCNLGAVYKRQVHEARQLRICSRFMMLG